MPTATSQRGVPVPPPTLAPDRRPVVVDEPDGWGEFARGDQPLVNGVAIWLLRSMVDFDEVVTISDIHGSALRCSFYIDLLVAGLVGPHGHLTAQADNAPTDLAREALLDLAHHQTLEHWIRLGHPHGHQFADTLVAAGDWEPLHYVLYHRYRNVRTSGASVCRSLAYVFDRPNDQTAPSVAALAALAGAWGYLGPKRREVPRALLAACGLAADFVGWATSYLNNRMGDIAAAASVNAQANLFGGGV